MKKFALSATAVLAMGTFAVAGGDIEPVVTPLVEVEETTDTSGFYFGLGYARTTLEFDGTVDAHLDNGEETYDGSGNLNAKLTSSVSSFIAGYQFNKYVAVEGRYLPQFVTGELSISTSGDFPAINGSGDATIDFSNLALYVKGMYPVTNELTVYGLLGYGQTSFGIEFMGNDVFEPDDTSFQWGIGASYALSEHTSIFVDYTVMYNDDDFDGLLEGVTGTFNIEDGTINIDTDITLDAFTFGIIYKF